MFRYTGCCCGLGMLCSLSDSGIICDSVAVRHHGAVFITVGTWKEILLYDEMYICGTCLLLELEEIS